MTLQEWSKAKGILVRRNDSGGTYVLATLYSHQTVDTRELWHLSDYVVSTVSGPVVWLVKRA
jgi:hypothetical protein